jgi:hypothetical protein
MPELEFMLPGGEKNSAVVTIATVCAMAAVIAGNHRIVNIVKDFVAAVDDKFHGIVAVHRELIVCVNRDRQGSFEYGQVVF